jgi:hypothetical protein
MRHSTFKGEVEIDYILRKSSSKSDVLVVSFPGAGGDRFKANSLGLGYMMTIGQFNVNALYIKSSSEEFIRAWFVGFEGNFAIERTMMELVRFACEQTGATRCVGVGSSLGGNCALYYGLKYNWDIIAGGARAKRGYVGKLIRQMIPTARQKGFSKHVYMCWGRGEPMWLNPDEAPSLVKTFDEAKVPYSMDLFDYSVHVNISRVFPHIIRRELGALLGMDPPNVGGQTERTAIEIAEEINASLKCLEAHAPELERIPPHLSIRNRHNQGSKRESVMLRTFVFGAQNYHWLPKAAAPIHHEPGRFWQTVPSQDGAYAHSMWFQATVLNHYKTTGQIAALKLVADSLTEFFPLSSFLREADRRARGYNALVTAQARAECLIDFVCTVHELKADPGYSEKIAWDWLKADVVETLRTCVRTEALLGHVTTNYSRLYFLLLVARFFKANEAFYRETYTRVMAAAVAMIDYQFDEQGVCTFEQVRMQHETVAQIRRIVDFVEANDFEPDQNFKKLKRKLDAVELVTAHLISPDGFTPNLGHTDQIKVDAVPAAGNLVRTSSNIAVLSSDAAYITIGGGSNVHSSFRHCDLLSFTFRYDGRQLVWDAGGGTRGLADYARSAVAHSALFCDEINYVTPDYGDWTALDDAVEADEYVLVSGKHTLIDGVTLSRKWLWLKPNIIVIYDDCQSESAHLYTQNFLFPNAKFDAKTQHRTTFSLAKGCTFSVTQLPAGPDFELKQFFGATDPAAPEQALRGSRIEKFRYPTKLTNFAYEKRAKSANFLTVLEAASGKDGELSFSSADIANGMLNVSARRGEEQISISEKLERDWLSQFHTAS